MAYTQEQLNKLQTTAQKYGGVDAIPFQEAVNKQFGAGAYDTIKSQLGATKTVSTTNTQTSPTPVVDAGTTMTSKGEFTNTGIGLPNYVKTDTPTPVPGTTPTPETTGPVAPAPGTATPTDFSQEKEKAYDEYSKAISLTDEEKKQQADLNQQMNDLGKSETFEQAYTRMQQESGIKSLQDQLVEYNKQIAEQNKGLKMAQEQVFTSSGGVTDAGVAQLRAYNSRDFIRNLADLSTAANNTSSQITALTDNIDNVLKLRQLDRENTRQNIMDRLDLLKNKVSPAELELLKVKLDQKLKTVNEQEQFQVDIAKAKMQDLLTKGDINSTDEFIKEKGIETAINAMFKQFPIDMVQTPQEKIERVKEMIAQGMTPQEALAVIKNEIVSSPGYKAYQEAQKMKNEVKPLTEKVGDNLYTYDPISKKWTLAIQGVSGDDYSFMNVGDGIIATTNKKTGKIEFKNAKGEVVNGGSYGNYKVSQDYGATSPNSKDNVKLANGKVGTPGIDFVMPVGTDVASTVSGKVTFVGGKGDYGNQIIITDNQGNQHMYSHLSDSQLMNGQTVNAGDIIASSGNTGFSTGAHLDYRVKGSNGQWLDPKTFLGGGNGNLAENKDIKTIAVGQVAYGKNVSDTEGKRIEKIINDNPNASTQDIVLAVRNLNIKDDKNKPEALRYLNMFNTMQKQPENFTSTISNYVNKGDWGGLARFTSKQIDNDVKATTPSDEFISESSFKTGRQTVNELLSLIEKNKASIGPVAGTVNNWLSKIKDSPDFTKIKSLLQMSQADIRKNFAGSAVTETEMKALENFIGGTEKMNPDNLITQLKSVKDKTEREFLNQRSPYGFDYNKYLGLNKTNTPKQSTSLFDSYYNN